MTLIGSIYVLLNPSFPDKLKLGRTTRTTIRRARELSRTAVPDGFIVIYDELVINCEKAERELHERFASKRVRKSKEFFRVSTKEAILAIQEIARRYPVPTDAESIRVPILELIQRRFGADVRPDITAVTLLQFRYLSALEVVSQAGSTHTPQRRVEELPLDGPFAPKYPDRALAESCAEELVNMDEFSFINVTDLLTSSAVEAILRRESLLAGSTSPGPPSRQR